MIKKLGKLQVFRWLVGIKNILKKTMKLNYILAIFILVVLSSCNDNKACIASDDFGFDKFEILSQPDKIYGERGNQYIDWTETSLMTSGDPIIIIVNGVGKSNDPDIIKYANVDSAWSPLYCEQATDFSKVCSAVKDMQAPECIQVDNRKSISNPLCLFKNGVGLYGVLVPQEAGVDNINDIKSYNLRPPRGSTTFHLGEDRSFEHNGISGLGGYKAGPSNKNQKLYFKILDRFYNDNAGSYEVIIKSGFVSSSGYPISRLVAIFKAKMDTLSESIFKNTILNPNFTTPVKATLILYIILLVISFMFGLVQVTHKEVLMRMLKMIIVTQLLTGESSYSFFKNYFFTFFIEGFDIVIGFITSGLGNSSGGMNFFDLILGTLLSYETNSKIMAYFFSAGFIIIPFLYLVIVIFILCIFRAVVLYITSYTAITLLIAIAPIFLVFMLFQFTNSFFQNWLKQFGNYFFQPLIVFAAITLFSVMIMSNFYKLLGNRICYNTIFELFDTPIIKFWQYEPVIAYKKIDGVDRPIIADIDVPGYSIVNGKACAPYQCKGRRFMNAPFLDPDDQEDAKYAVAKQNRDYEFLIPKSIYIILLAYLLHKLFDILPAIGKGIAGTEFSQADLSAASKSVGNALKSVATSPLKAAYVRADIYSGGKLSAVVDKVNEVKYKVTNKVNSVRDKIGGAIDKVTGNEYDVEPLTIYQIVIDGIDKKMSATVGEGYDKIKSKVKDGINKAMGIK